MRSTLPLLAGGTPTFIFTLTRDSQGTSFSVAGIHPEPGWCQGECLNLLFVNFLQRVSGCEGVGWAKNRGLEGVWEIGELVGLAYVLSESVLS